MINLNLCSGLILSVGNTQVREIFEDCWLIYKNMQEVMSALVEYIGVSLVQTQTAGSDRVSDWDNSNESQLWYCTCRPPLYMAISVPV